MRVHPSQLIEGCIVTNDIFSLSSSPIIPQKTVLNGEKIGFINAFLIKEVEVEPFLSNGDRFDPEAIEEEQEEKDQGEETTFSMQYKEAVLGYKRLFTNWQAGSQIDIPDLRKIIVPLLEMAINSPNEIFRLPHYSTKEDYLYHHAVAVAAISSVLANRLHYQKGEWIQIGLAGALSDCGMAKIDNQIINKRGHLTKNEFQEIKKHPEISYSMLKQVAILTESVRKAVFQHHERIDGSGYPLGLKGENLHTYAKIISVSDIFHAMTSERFYKPKQSPFKVLETIMQDNFGKYDLQVVEALTKAITNFSSGTRVALSNEQIGEIVFIEQQHPTRPMIKLDSGEIIPLSSHRDLFIEDILG
jgi:HD-GYP domain-containing protein (c-di-GMP phosphodiesterase class II)